MKVAELIGDVVAHYLRAEAAEHGTAGDGTARYVIDCLSPEQTAAIARSILADPELKQRVEIKLPVAFLQGQDIPPELLTDKPATYFRTAPCDKPILLIANTGDDEEQSLKEVTKIGAPELQDHPSLWVRVAATGLPLTAENLRWWEKALAGVFELRMFSLDRLASFAIATRTGIVVEGHPILHALGAALPTRFPIFRRSQREEPRTRFDVEGFLFERFQEACVLSVQADAFAAHPDRGGAALLVRARSGRDPRGPARPPSGLHRCAQRLERRCISAVGV